MNRCRVFWGSHGCALPRGHVEPHSCGLPEDEDGVCSVHDRSVCRFVNHDGTLSQPYDVTIFGEDGNE